MNQPPILELVNVSRTYDVKRSLFQSGLTIKAVDGISLKVAKGETLGLVGESGCGKSTLAKMLLGLLEPSSGHILIKNRELDTRRRLELAKSIQPIFQDPYSSLNPRKTIAQIVGLPLKLHSLGNAQEQRKAVREMLDLVGMPERTADQYPGQLSGGQRQRVAIARALILKPEILICDEPTSALDVSVQAQILNLLLDLKKDLGLTYVFISHDLGVVEHLVDTVAVMYRGQIVENQSREQLFANPQHPYTRMLLDSALTPEPGLGVPDIKRDFETAMS